MKRFFRLLLDAILVFHLLSGMILCSLKPCLATSGNSQIKSGQAEKKPEAFSLSAGKILAATTSKPQTETDQEDNKISLPSNAQSVTSLFANFIQKKNSSILARQLLSTGFVCLRNKNKQGRQQDSRTMQNTDLLWSYTRPKVQALLYRNGQAMMLQDDGNPRPQNKREQAFTANIVKMLLFWLNPAQEDITNQFQIAENDHYRRKLVLLPKQTEFFRKMTVIFSENRQTLDELFFEEKNGNTLHLTFTDTSLNQPLPSQCQPLYGRVAE